MPRISSSTILFPLQSFLSFLYTAPDELGADIHIFTAVSKSIKSYPSVLALPKYSKPPPPRSRHCIPASSVLQGAANISPDRVPCRQRRKFPQYYAHSVNRPAAFLLTLEPVRHLPPASPLSMTEG